MPDSYDTREAASRQLLSAGEGILPLLEPLSRHPSPEVRFRVQSIVRSLAQVPLRRLQEEIAAFCSQPEERLDVERAMCFIARLMDRQVVEKDLLRMLDEMAAKVTEHLANDGDPDPSRADPQKAVAAIQQVVYKDYALRGNDEDYGNPDNSSLAFVLKERKGKPILLAEITVSVARRAKIPIVGIPTGGRYIAKYDGAQAPAGFPRDDIYLDPFGGGVVLTREDRLRLFPNYDPDRMVPPATRRETIARILRNIVTDYRGRGAAADPDGQELAERMLELLTVPMAVP
ncbi:MAG TPA: transglutaminase-like domain-containing protein [Pirellulaceae bacterium]|nr:transglutaminase-like domain-containing protein [Pirellulaceae bacterium]